MVLSVGTRVRLARSGDEGIVVEVLPDGMVQVRVFASDMTIPVFEEDLLRVEPVQPLQHHKAKIVPGKAPKVVKAPERPPSFGQYGILKSQGIQLAFDPIIDANTQHPDQFKIFLVNDMAHSFVFDLSYFKKGARHLKKDGKLESYSAMEFGNFFTDELNDSPEFEFEFRRITTEGLDGPLQRTLKLRAKQFFSKITTAPILNRPVHLIKLVEPENTTHAGEKEDLAAYTKRQTRPTLLPNDTYSPYEPVNLKESAEFIQELDLHLESLNPGGKKLSNADALKLQLQHFDKFIEKAVRLGAERVFVIHGVGKGRLREEIFTRVMKMPEIKSFKNEFHPRYGFGATEIILK